MPDADADSLVVVIEEEDIDWIRWKLGQLAAGRLHGGLTAEERDEYRRLCAIESTYLVA